MLFKNQRRCQEGYMGCFGKNWEGKRWQVRISREKIGEDREEINNGVGVDVDKGIDGQSEVMAVGIFLVKVEVEVMIIFVGKDGYVSFVSFLEQFLDLVLDFCYGFLKGLFVILIRICFFCLLEIV